MEWVTTPAGVLVSIAAAAGAWIFLYKKVFTPIRDAYRRFALEVEVIHDLASRELTHNGGESMKDAVRRIDQRTEASEARVADVADKAEELVDSVEAIATVIDRIVDRKQEDHDEIWVALRSLGVDRRRNG